MKLAGHLRLESLTVLRGFLAVLVLICHGGQRVGWLESDTFLKHFLVGFGHLGVVSFFILSGFILFYVYSNRDWVTKDYLVNRLARIYPLYLVCLIIAFPIDWFSPGFSTDYRLAALFLNLTSFQSWFDFANGRFNGPGWTISVEFFFYGLFPLFLFLVKESVKLFVLALVVLFVATGFFWDTEVFELSHRFPLMRLWEFVLGILLGRFFLGSEKKKTLSPYQLKLISVFLIIGGALTGSYWPEWTGLDFAEWIVLAICGGGTILALAFKDNCSSSYPNPKLVYLGEISFAIYLMHDAIQRYLKVFSQNYLIIDVEKISVSGKIIFIVFSLVLSVISAMILYRWVEIPFRKKIRSMFT